MTTDGRRAKVTAEHKEEARRLKALWDSLSHPSQAEFGELFEVGNQSAVGQFLRGQVPLSLKAAQGFARGLGIGLEAFTPRLAAKAAEIANMAPVEGLSSEVMSLAREIESLTGDDRAYVLQACRQAVMYARKLIATRVEQDVHGKRKHSS